MPVLESLHTAKTVCIFFIDYYLLSTVELVAGKFDSQQVVL